VAVSDRISAPFNSEPTMSWNTSRLTS
jgi:hypothetical protein